MAHPAEVLYVLENARILVNHAEHVVFNLTLSSTRHLQICVEVDFKYVLVAVVEGLPCYFTPIVHHQPTDCSLHSA